MSADAQYGDLRGAIQFGINSAWGYTPIGQAVDAFAYDTLVVVGASGTGSARFTYSLQVNATIPAWMQIYVIAAAGGNQLPTGTPTWGSTNFSNQLQVTKPSLVFGVPFTWNTSMQASIAGCPPAGIPVTGSASFQLVLSGIEVWNAAGSPVTGFRVAGLSTHAYQGTIPIPPMFVDAAATGANDGSSWINAFTKLQDALDLSPLCFGYASTEIRVAQGTYWPDEGFLQTADSDSASFALRNKVVLRGGFGGGESILSGDIQQDGVDSNNSLHVVGASYVDQTAVIDGFTIRDGNADAASGPPSWGGGMILWQSRPTITNCTFKANSARVKGGAFYSDADAGTLITDCTFIANQAFNASGGTPQGGAIFMKGVNPAYPRIERCTFDGNSALGIGVSFNSGDAGAIYLDANAYPQFSRCLFTNNSAPSGHGGAIRGGGGVAASLIAIDNCLFANNVAWRGGAIAGPGIALTECTIAHNTAGYGGGVYTTQYAPPQGSVFTLVNCIVGANTASVDDPSCGGSWDPQASYCLVQGGHPGAGNIAGSPNFVDPANNDFHLLGSSPGIDAGNSTATLSTVDLDGLPRMVDDCAVPDMGLGSPPIDMGAYEVQGSPSVSYCTAGTTTSGCNAMLSSIGNASASASSGFLLTVSQFEGQRTVLMFYGVNGRDAVVWKPESSSFLCVKSPVQRMASSNSGGTTNTCDGSFSIDWNSFMATHPTALGQPLSIGQVVDAQAYFRDPPAPGSTNLSNGLEFILCP